METMDVKITLAIASAIIGLLGLMISKENKVSEFRQKWIDDLRSEISSAIAHAYSIRGFSIVVRKNEDDEKITREKIINEHFLGFRQAETSIRLRLTKSNDNDEKFLTNLDNLVKSLNKVFNLIETSDAKLDKESNEYKELDEFEAAFIESSNALLKSEWERVKNGEPLFNFVLSIFISFIISAILFSVATFMDLAIEKILWLAIAIVIFLFSLTRKLWLSCAKKGITKGITELIKKFPSLKNSKCPFHNMD